MLKHFAFAIEIDCVNYICAMIPKWSKESSVSGFGLWWAELGKHFCQFVDTVAIFDDR